MKLKENQKLLNIQEVSELLNLKISKIRSMVFKKEIPYIKIGRLIRFNLEDVSKWVEEKKKFELSSL